MKKFYLSLVALCGAVSALAAGQSATITSNPSPAVSTKALEVTISTGDLGGTVYCYTWCSKVNGSEKQPSWDWNGVNTSKFQMTGTGGNYKFVISDIKTFYGLTDAELEGLTQLGFIAKNANGGQTADLFITVEQGRKTFYSGGDGSQGNPYLIKTVNDLVTLASTPDDWGAGCYIRLGADITVGGFSGIGSKENPFKGHFDGAGYSLKGARITATEVGSAAGVFNAVSGAEIYDLGVVDATVAGATFVGGLVGYAESGSISRCFTTGAVSGSSICVGGLVGENRGAEIVDCYSAAEVTNSDDYATGGLAGRNAGKIQRTYASGRLQGKNYVGGLVGANYGTVKASVGINEQVKADADANFVARLGGNGNGENLSENNMSWDGMPLESSSRAGYGDHADRQPSSKMVSQDTYKDALGWDFNHVWEWVAEGNRSYPALQGLRNQSNPMPEDVYNTSGLGNLYDVTLNIYPNPASDVLHVVSPQGIASCSLFGLNGALVADVAVESGASTVTMDVASLAGGVYMLRVVSADGGIVVNPKLADYLLACLLKPSCSNPSVSIIQYGHIS